MTKIVGKEKVESYPNSIIGKPLVSVLIQTYQHANFIKQCLDGILMQQTNFPFEIILGEDESTDGTREICKAYSEKYPDKINLFLRSRKDVIYINGNPTGRYNFIENLKAAQGKYIALCEGDDYWTDPLKLQKQVDFLEVNPEYGICFHESEVIWDDAYENKQSIKLNSEFYWNRMEPEKSVYTITDVFNGPFMATASVIFRKKDPVDFPDWFFKAASGDITLYALILNDNKIKFINEIMCAYRRHEGGITKFHRSSYIILNRIETLINLNFHFKNKYIKQIEQATNAYLNDLNYLNPKEMMLLFKYYFSSSIVKTHHIKYFSKKLFKRILN